MEHIFLSIIIPAYKEEGRIGPTLLSIEEYFKDKSYTYEVIIVNDGSPDRLASVVEEHMKRHKNVRFIDNPVNRGKGYAVKCGMFEARGDYALFMDADNSVSISHLDAFLAEVSKGSDVVIGSIEVGNAVKKENNGFYRRFLSRISKAPVRLLATPGIYDTQRGFKLFSRKAMRIIFPKQTVDRFAFDIEILVIAISNGLRLKELPVIFNNPVGSTVRLSAYVRSLVDLVQIRIKKALGAYAVPGLRPRPAGMQAERTNYGRLAVLGICLALSVGLLASVRPTDTVTATSVATSTQSLIPRIISQFTPQAELPENASPSWIYDREPTTKAATGTLLLISFLCVLVGSDLIAGLVLPRVNAAVRKSLLATTPLPDRGTKRRYPLLTNPV
ncbi:MAG TPA: dolichyl-phosphate beta-glucosyltransferase [Candidatus Paceibacterota bacterium]